MTVLRLEHIGVVVDDLAAATAFFVALGLEVEGEASVEGELVDRINGLEGVRSDVVMLRTPDDSSTARAGQVPLARIRGRRRAGAGQRPGHPPPPLSWSDMGSSLASLRAHGGELVGELVNYEDVYWLCYVRGPAEIIVELAEKIG